MKIFRNLHMPQVSLALMAVLLAGSVSAQDAVESQSTPRGVISSAPKGLPTAAESTSPAPVASSASVNPLNDLVQGKGAASAAQGVEKEENLRWLMASDQMPFPLRYRELTYTGTLHLALPDLREMRLMLPGVALDAASRANGDVSKFITNAIGIAAQDRARQLEAFNAWAERTTAQKATIKPLDTWLLYAFSQDLQKAVMPFREGISSQSEPEMAKYILELTRVMAQVTPVMEAAQGYDQRMAWYRVLVQFKEGLQLVQAQQVAGDTQILKVIDEYLSDNQAVPRPPGDAPKMSPNGGRVGAAVEAPVLSEVNVTAMREPAVQVVPEEEKSGNTLLGGIIGLVMVVGFLAFFIIPLRKRLKGKPPAKTE